MPLVYTINLLQQSPKCSTLSITLIPGSKSELHVMHTPPTGIKSDSGYRQLVPFLPVKGGKESYRHCGENMDNVVEEGYIEAKLQRTTLSVLYMYFQ